MQSDSKIDPRRMARLLAIQFLFSKLFSERNNIDTIVFEPQTLLDIVDETKFDKKLYINLIEGVESSQEEIDKILKNAAPEWPLDQLNPINLIILRIGLWEGFIGMITPPKVAINEAIEMDKVLSSVSNSQFINGVLGKIYENQDNLLKNIE